MTLTSTISSVLRDVSSRNTKESLEEGLKILLRLLDNVISDPGNTKYRRIRSENKIIKEKLLSLDGMNDLLKEIGFVLGEDAYDLPTNVLIARLKEYRTEIDKAMSEKSESEGTGAVKKKKKGVERVPFRAGKSYKERTNFSKVINSPNQFLRQIESLSDEVMQYEDEVLQETGRSMMPLEKLKNKTMESLRKIQKSIKEGKSKDEPSYDDLFIWELAEWFKTDFFTWVNALPCPICKNEKTTPVGHAIEDGVRVEQYRCCNNILKFYRYNDVLKLLQTRKGRCGEWANCFTFLCRCLGYNARYIYSTEDHVWTEVYSTLQNRWIHVDPSDNVIDAPLMYEHGWKKEIRYIFAFSRDDVQDVTWRYTNQHKKVMEKRRNCTEKELLETILAVRKKRQEGFSELKLKNYMKRTLKELADLTVEREATEDEKRGRSSGSLEWRQARSESSASNSFYVFEPLPDEIQSKQFNVRYSCSLDTYERFLRNSSGQVAKILHSVPGWTSSIYHSDKIFKKYEPDWKMVYLARTEGSDSASIMWRFDFSNSNLVINNFQMKFDTKTYENGKVDVFLLDKNGLRINDLKELKGESKFSIKAVLTGGKGDCAWQHTQLFRQEKGAKDFPFIVNIIFK